MRGRGSLVIDFQGPFELDTRLIKDGPRPFAVVGLWPDVGIYITTQKEADDIIAALRQAKTLLQASQKRAP